MSLRVTHIVRQYFPSVGGMEDVVRSIADNQVRQAGHQVRIITLNRLFRQSTGVLAREDTVSGVRVTRLPYTGSSRYPLCPQVLREIRDADVIHVHGVDFFYDFLAATKIIHRKPMIMSTHGGFFHTEFASRLKTFWFQTITRASARAYERIVATSENDGALFRRIIRPGQLKVIENGVDTAKYAGCSSPDLTRTLIYFGRWSRNKGIPEAIGYVKQLAMEDSRWRLIIAGREYDYNEAELARLIADQGASANVRLEPNPSDEMMRQLIGEASYFLCLSRHEGFGLAAIEAMSAGLTPVLSDIPPFRRLIENGGVGLLLDEHQGSVQPTKLLYLHGQGNAAAGERRDAAMKYASGYGWQEASRHYLSLYTHLERRQ